MKLILPSCRFQHLFRFETESTQVSRVLHQIDSRRRRERAIPVRMYTMIHRVNRYSDCTILRMVLAKNFKRIDRVKVRGNSHFTVNACG